MAQATEAKISWRWSIYRGTYRMAVDPVRGLTLRVTNRRTQGGWGPVVWDVFTRNGLAVGGEVWQGTRYSALVRQAMFDAEQAAEAWLLGRDSAALDCDDCGRTDGTHDYSVEH